MNSGGAAFVGDLHLSHQIYSRLPSMLGDSLFALSQIAAYCEEHDLDLVLLGDNFDRRNPDADLVRDFHALLDNVRQVGYIVGQHDKQNDVQWPGILPVNGRVNRIDLHRSGASFLGGMLLFGIDHTPRAMIQERLKCIPTDRRLVLCLHQTVRQVMDIGDESDVEGRRWDLDAAWIPENVQYTVMGDWHGLPQSGETDGRKWMYTGAMTMRSVSEPATKSFLVGRPSGDGIEWERIPLQTRPFLYTDVKYGTELEKWCEGIKHKAIFARTLATDDKGIPVGVAVPLVVLRYDVSIDDAYKQITAALGSEVAAGNVHLHTIPVRSYVEDAPDFAAAAHNISVQAAVDETVDKETSPAVHELVTELAHAADPKGVVTAFKRTHDVIDDPGRV